MHSQHCRIYDEVDLNVYYINMHHNGDYSGNVVINVRAVPVVAAPLVDSGSIEYPEINRRYPAQEVEVPMEALKNFMANYIRYRRIGELEDAEFDDLVK